jgi:hypothetical protein
MSLHMSLRAIDRGYCGVLMEPQDRDDIDLQRIEGNSPKDTVEIGGKRRIEDAS